ncbi:NAD(P)H-dependent oxidoreductase subunit E [Thauera aromatica]|uniref:NAD-reducing hydrogenase subunit HoxF n=1 Tax=Thauera aromatica K172 TaxID=44139 RepID=A0A2R4BNY7_THAAR|nr:NAD(P)H-dependent oxidoreductase subunit E [Thauera aromatica]AVR88893.1 NAD-reducing hydrogenase subunit HoxF [Thauera aromatica K172]
MSDAELEPILAANHHDPRQLLQILRQAQERAGHLPTALLERIASALTLPLAQVLATASFYSLLRTGPAPAYDILFADNITDRMQGGPALAAALCRALELAPGLPAGNGRVRVGTTSCTGLCDQGPALLVNQRPLTRMSAERVVPMADLIRRGVAVDDWPAEWFRIEPNLRRRDALLGAGLAPGEALAAALARSPGGLLAEIEASRLRGRGGAGYPTAAKWRACRAAPGEAHYVVCNADEGEPGTFKDRVLLSDFPQLVIDGMGIAAHAVGAHRGFIYLRGEYRHLLDPLEALLAERRRQGLLGTDILGRGFDFDIEIHLGAGAYVCGEESALLESLEGRPGRPRIRPPFPVSRGYRGQPTTVNNVETLALAGLVAIHGGEVFRAIGTAQSSGTKLLSVSGDVERPGIYEYPFGVTVAEVLADCGARATQAVQIAGAAGHCLAPAEFGRRIAFEDVPTGGSFMVFDERRDLFDVAHAFVDFFAHESCGFCTPCRVGTAVNRRLMDKIAAGRGVPADVAELAAMDRLLRSASHCGLGSTATLALTDIVDKFRPAFSRRLRTEDFVPAFDLDAALAPARQATGRDDRQAHFHPDPTPLPDEPLR